MIGTRSFGTKWPIVPLDEAVEFLDHMRRPVTASDRQPGPYPYFGANGQQDSVSSYLFDEPLVLLAEDGGHFGVPDKTIAYAIEGKSWVNNHAHVLRPKNKITLRYLVRVLEQYDVVPLITGTTRGKLTKGAASGIQIPLPPLEEQKRIAAVLDKADALRRKRQEALRLTDDFLRSTFLDMFGDPLTNTRKLPMKPLRDFGEIVTGNTPSRAEADNFGNELEWIKSDNINTPNYYLTSAVERLSLVGAARARKVPANSILVTCIAGSPSCIGNVALTDREVAFNQQINAVVPFDNTDPFFLFTQFLVGKKKIQNASTNGMKGMVSKGTFSEIEFVSPSEAKQREFGAIFRRILELHRKNDKALTSTETLFSALQQRAFSGQL